MVAIAEQNAGRSRGDIIARDEVDGGVRRGGMKTARQRRSNFVDERLCVVRHPENRPLFRQPHQRLFGDEVTLPEMGDLSRACPHR